MARTFVIAEAGSTHDRRLTKAFDLIEAAAIAGADAVKFQFFSDPDRLADRRRVPEGYRDIYRRYRVPDYWLAPLKDGCDRADIEFMCTVYLPQDVAVLAPLVKRFKVASFEARDAEFLAAHASFDKPLIVSTGMMSARESWELKWRLLDDHKLAVEVLHCVSAYPAPIEQMNLALLRPEGHDGCGGRSRFDGLSDHSRDIRTGGLAVAAGAQIIEAHLRLDDTDPQNPDYATAFAPAEFAEYVRNIRFSEKVMGDGEKKLQPAEAEMARYRVGGAA